MAKEEKVNILGVILATLIVITPLLLYSYTKVKNQYDNELNDIKQHYNDQSAELKLAICKAYGFENYEKYTYPGTNNSYDECSVPHCEGISYWPMDDLVKNRYNLSYIKKHLGCGGGGPGGQRLDWKFYANDTSRNIATPSFKLEIQEVNISGGE